MTELGNSLMRRIGEAHRRTKLPSVIEVPEAEMEALYQELLSFTTDVEAIGNRLPSKKWYVLLHLALYRAEQRMENDARIEEACRRKKRKS